MQGGHPAGLCCPQNQTQCLLHIWHCSWSEGKATAQEIGGAWAPGGLRVWCACYIHGTYM